jgi:hypothetical protein
MRGNSSWGDAVDKSVTRMRLPPASLSLTHFLNVTEAVDSGIRSGALIAHSGLIEGRDRIAWSQRLEISGHCVGVSRRLAQISHQRL